MSREFERILESKRALRKQLAEKPIAEKLRIVEELAERSLATRKDNSAQLPETPWAIPPTWRWSRMGDVATIIGGGTPKTDRADFFGGEVPWITPADLSGYKAKTISRGARNITEAGLANSGARLMPANTVLFSSRAPIGYVAIAANPVATNQGFKSFVLDEELLPDFVYYFLQRAKEFAVALASGTTFLEISGKNAARLPIPVPPLSEQRRIVAEIEKQFTRLEAGVAALRRVQANLKRYRAAVLKAACEGCLVPIEAELAKAGNRKAKFETGEVLLARILTERRKNWQGRGHYKEPVAPDTEKLPTLPEGWTWVSADQISSQITDGEHIQPRYTTEGYPMLSAKHVRNGYVIYTDAPFISEADFQACLKRCAPTRDDILIVCVGATTGRAAIVGDAKPFAVVRSVLLIRALIHPRFMLAWVQSPWCQTWIQSASGSSAQAHFYINNAKNMSVPLPPLAEQTRIVAEVERRLSVVEELNTVVSANLQRAIRLRQSILQKAFTGGL